jgi:hypothetical protein
MKITLTPNEKRNGFSVPSEYNKGILGEWLKKYNSFKLEPDEEETRSSRGYLEGGVIPAYCEWQYGINARDLRRDTQRRNLFYTDFNFEIVANRNGDPVKSPVSSKGLSKHILGSFTRYAEENGCPIPNPALYKLWRDKWSMDFRFPTYFDFLDFLGLQVDAMPSQETLDKLKVKDTLQIEYPESIGKPVF